MAFILRTVLQQNTHEQKVNLMCRNKNYFLMIASLINRKKKLSKVQIQRARKQIIKHESLSHIDSRHCSTDRHLHHSSYPLTNGSVIRLFMIQNFYWEIISRGNISPQENTPRYKISALVIITHFHTNYLFPALLHAIEQAKFSEIQKHQID